MGGGAWAHSDHIAGSIDVHVLEAQLLEQALQFLRTRRLMERRRGDLTNPDLLVDKMRFIPLSGVQRFFDVRILHQTGRVLSQDAGRRCQEAGDRMGQTAAHTGQGSTS